MKKFGLPLLILTLLLSASCGVKAPPLPPLPVTAQQSDAQEATPAPSPSPSTEPSARASAVDNKAQKK